MAVIDYNKIAASVYNTVMSLNSAATSLVGLDAIWCRLLPYDNGEDVIVLEYTLHLYDCPSSIKVICNNSEYLVGNFSIDLWGMHQDVPLEISVDITNWKSVYGENTMPQKGDFVLIPMLHKPFEVISSVVVYTVGQQPTSYKCVLGKWQHNANRKESEDFHISIDELTESQDRLFGDAISKEVADAVVEVETAYNTTSYVDPIKDFDMNSIVVEDLIGINGNQFSNAYYSFINATKNVLYHINGEYDTTCKENHLVFSCWFRALIDSTLLTNTFKFIDLYLKEKDYWYFNFSADMQIYEGEEVSVYRGGIIKLKGIIETKDCESGYVLKISASDCLKASAKVNNWWTSGKWKILKFSEFNIFNAYNGEDKVLKIAIDGNNLNLIVNEESRKIPLKNVGTIDLSNWHYLNIDFSPNGASIILIKNSVNNATQKYTNKEVYNSNININIKSFSFNNLSIENAGNDIDMTNIRLYENEYPVNDTYKLDMYSAVTRNASKLILVDSPNAANDMTFRSKVR